MYLLKEASCDQSNFTLLFSDIVFIVGLHLTLTSSSLKTILNNLYIVKEGYL